MKRIFCVFVIFLTAASYGASADDVTVNATVDRTEAQVDEEIALTVQILGARGNLQAPRLPAFEGFDSFYTGRTSQFTFVNGKSSSTVEFNYVLVPKVAGEFTLSAIDVWVEGKNIRTEPIEIRVTAPQVRASGALAGPLPRNRLSAFNSPLQPASPSPAQAPPAFSPPAGPAPQVVQDDNVFVRATVDHETVFPNEQVLLTYTLYTRYDTRYEGFEEEPSISGFWIEDFPLDRDLSRETVTIRGRRYVKADIRKIALFPTAPATYTIQPGVLKISVQKEPQTNTLFDDFFNDSFFSGNSFFTKRVEQLLKPEPIQVTVRPFPDVGRPASFNGAVGRFRLEATADKEEVKQNEPVTLKITVEGEGNIDTLPKPGIPELTGFKIYDGDSSTQLFKNANTLAGKKNFEIIFIPTEAGELAIPPLEFSFFDPRSQSYQTLKTPKFPLKVTPSEEPFQLPAALVQKEAYKKEVQLEAKDIRYIHQELSSGRQERIFNGVLGGLLVLNLAGLVGVGGGLLKRRQEALFAKDHALKRRKLARATAEKRLKALKRAARNEQSPEAGNFADEAEKILSEYLCNKFNVSPYSFTREWLDEALTEKWGKDDPLRARVRDFYNLSGEARFGRGAMPASERKQFTEFIEIVIRRIEKEL